VRRPVRLAALVAVVGVVAGAGWWFISGGAVPGTASAADPGDGAGDDVELATATVERRTLTATESLSGKLGYAGSYEVPGGLSGTLTWMVPTGTVVTAGEPLYEVDGGVDASLMYGSRPAWRTLEPGVSNGFDVRQLEENLQALGYTREGDEIDKHWDSDTTAAVKRWQRDHGQTADGVLGLGEVVFLPEAIRITDVSATPGSRVGQGGALATATSTRRVVSVDLDADDRDLLEVGTIVTIQLPDGTTTDGTVSEIGRVAETSSDGQGGTSTTLPVTITLADPEAGADLDAAPVDISIVTETREDVLTVPVNALLALIEGGYAVEVVDPVDAASASPSASPAASSSATATHLVRVEPGLFDGGLVEVTSEGLEAGDTVVVPS
jgi:peptidoglycan hydrolase-like protein with peptidoglycan-binding domain